MLPYKSIQKSWTHFILIPLIIILIIFTRHFSPPALAVLSVITIILFLFHSLIVEVTQQYIKIKFGPGLIRKKLKIENVESCKPVEIPKGSRIGSRINAEYILYNVTGNEAVELTLKNKKRKVRIGTDDSNELCQVIEEAINSS